jgi:hypothetical protein
LHLPLRWVTSLDVRASSLASVCDSGSPSTAKPEPEPEPEPGRALWGDARLGSAFLNVDGLWNTRSESGGGGESGALVLLLRNSSSSPLRCNASGDMKNPLLSLIATCTGFVPRSGDRVVVLAGRRCWVVIGMYCGEGPVF